MPTVTIYKLFRRRKDGTLGPLFINRRLRIPLNTWLDAEDHPTKGFAHRPGWHATWRPCAPHLLLRPKNDAERVWAECETTRFTTYARPESQGGVWVLAQNIRVIRVLSPAEVQSILRRR